MKTSKKIALLALAACLMAGCKLWDRGGSSSTETGTLAIHNETTCSLTYSFARTTSNVTSTGGALPEMVTNVPLTPANYNASVTCAASGFTATCNVTLNAGATKTMRVTSGTGGDVLTCPT